MSWESVVAGGLFAAALGAIATVLVQLLRGRSDRAVANQSVESELEKHNDLLSIQLIAAARTDMDELRRELADLRPLAKRIEHLESALEHIAALLAASDDQQRMLARYNARIFLEQMERLDGRFRNAVQRGLSSLNPRHPVTGKRRDETTGDDE